MRFKVLLAGLAALSLNASSFAQNAAQPPATTAGDFSPAAFRGHVTFLADDLLEGREAGTRGYDLAARYVASQFEVLGLTPAANGSFFQPVEFVRYVNEGPATITVGGRSFENGTDVIFRANPSREAVSVEAPLVFVGYGLDLPAAGLNDYAGLNVRGAIVVALNGTPSDLPSDVAAHVNSDKRRMAAARGAAGMIILRGRAESQRTPFARLTGAANRPGTTWLGRDGRPHSESGALRFSATVDSAAAEAIFAGARRSFNQVLDEAARPGARPRGFALRQRARVTQAAATETRFSSPNVVAVLPGTDPALANEYVLLMAHLDHIGIREGGEGDRIRNGAMDNASGIATLLEVARTMSRPENRTRRPVLIAAVTAEEKGLLGADFMARHPVVDGRVVGVVNLDMPVLTYNFEDVIAFGAEHSTMGPTVARAAARMGVGLIPDPLPEQGLFTRSDHYRFVQQGVPSVFLMTGFGGEGRERFTHFLSTNYHQPSDDLSLPFNWEAAARFARLNYLIAREIADAPEAPLWYADSFFGTAFGGGQRRAERPASQGQAAARGAR